MQDAVSVIVCSFVKNYTIGQNYMSRLFIRQSLFVGKALQKVQVKRIFNIFFYKT